jgi:signal transduction histidine kinase
MSLKHIFRKYFLVTVGILFAFLFLANFTLNLILRAQNETPPPLRSAIFFARLIDDLGPNRFENFNHIERLSQASLPLQFVLVDANGKALIGDSTLVPKDWPELNLPKNPLESTTLEQRDERSPPLAGMLPMIGGNHDGKRHAGPRLIPSDIPPGSRRDADLGPPESDLAPPRANRGPPPQGGGPNPPRDQIIRLPGEPVQFLFVHLIPNELQRHSHTQFFAISIALLIVSILLGVGVAMAFIFRSLGKNVALADSVIAELQKGNLKARFPIKKRNEFGAAMVRFNRMADEIELLVERVVNTEKSRMKLLQELAHDLRTPVASMKNLLETLQSREETLTPTVKRELVSLSVKEVDYFGRLIEDLLILAQVSEPRYHAKKESVDLIAIFTDESESAAVQANTSDKQIFLDKNLPRTSLFTMGDALLLRRMFRNLAVNAFSFAKSSVHVSFQSILPDTATFIVDDDGPGFSEEGIKSFGVRRITRVLGSEQNGRLSVGLGSVIVKTVAELHRGTVQVENRLDSTGNVVGARVIVTLDLLA